MKFIIAIAIFGTMAANAQTVPAEKDSVQTLEEVEVVGTAKKKIETDLKMGVTVDEYLSSSTDISFIKRGSFAWEPLLHNMSSERASVTIDGMHIFGACTDKMDPVTSYVESNNLSGIAIKSGQTGSLHGATIAGNIDLNRKNTPFGLEKKWGASYQSGFEFNNNQWFNLGNISYSGKRLAADASVSYRKAGNYSDGNNDEVKHSQFSKFNTSLGMAYKTGERSSVRADAIFDVAKNVGFPALPMDLWLSRAIITSVSYRQLFEGKLAKNWETKLYFNAIEHYMDDTTRPENLVHMDMPGWSTTYGLLSKTSLQQGRFTSEIQLNAYENLSIAEMHMYPQDRSKKTMFAYSWPEVTTRFAGVSANGSWEISEKSRLNFGGAVALHYNRSKYAEFNRIFHPEAAAEKTRFLPNLHLGYLLETGDFQFSIGSGYGHRAPSVSEGYGYYIYNSFDRYDYIGNPNLKNEISYEINAGAGFKNNKASIEAKVNYFYIKNYIVGKILNAGSPMNYQSVGVKGYTSLPHATLFNLSLNASYQVLSNLHWEAALTYARGRDANDGNLPFIRPLSYQTTLHFKVDQFGLQTSFNGDATQRDYSPFYGEDQTPAYAIWNVSADYTFAMGDCVTVVQVGAENLFDQYYSTYADWGNIPRMGRNIFTSLKFNF
ncbi:TonB-dependent receptor plug domain-containing protein [Sinomicrobium sp.]